MALGLLLIVGGAFAQQSSRPPTSVAIESLITEMKAITQVPYTLDQQGNLTGRSEQDERRWFGLVARLNDVVAAASPSDVDDKAVSDMADQFRDRLSFGGNPLAQSLGRVGSRGILALIARIKSESDREIQYRLSDGLFAVAMQPGSAAINDQALNAMVDLLDHPYQGVVGPVVQALGALGPRARAALPALEKLRVAEEMKGPPVLQLGPSLGDLLTTAIADIRADKTP